MATNGKPEPTPLERSHDSQAALRSRALARARRLLRAGRQRIAEALRHARAVRHLDGSDTPESARVLCETHAQLRVAVIHAGRLIRRLNFGCQDCRELALLRRVLREARAVRRGETRSALYAVPEG
jgi:hypothetical protein